MATGKVTIRVYPDATARDAETNWDAGDMVYLPSVGLTTYNGSSWKVAPNSGGSIPQVPATPDAQDVVDALITLGLVTQAP